MTTLKTEIPPDSSQVETISSEHVPRLDIGDGDGDSATRQFLLNLRTKNLLIYRGPYECLHTKLSYLQILMGALGFVHFAYMLQQNGIEWENWTSPKWMILAGLELVVWIGSVYCLGWKKVPANFACFLLLRFFIYLDCTDNIPSLKVKHKPVPTSPTEKASTQPELYFMKTSILRSICYIAGALLVMLLMKVDISHCDSLCLVGCVVATTWTTVVLLSAMAIEHIGRDNHLLMCELWAYLCAIVTLFVVLHLFQRLNNRIRLWNFNKSHQPRAMMEIFIFLFSVYFGIRYIQGFHRHFSVQKLLSQDEINKHLMLLIPHSLTKDNLHSFQMTMGNILGNMLGNLAWNIFSPMFGETDSDDPKFGKKAYEQTARPRAQRNTIVLT